MTGLRSCIYTRAAAVSAGTSFIRSLVSEWRREEAIARPIDLRDERGGPVIAADMILSDVYYIYIYRFV